MSRPYQHPLLDISPFTANSPYNYEEVLRRSENSNNDPFQFEIGRVDGEEEQISLALANSLSDIQRTTSPTNSQDEYELAVLQSVRSSYSQEAEEDQTLVNLIFRLNDEAKIYGSYVAAQLRGESSMSQSMEVLWCGDDCEGNIEYIEDENAEGGLEVELAGSLAQLNQCLKDYHWLDYSVIRNFPGEIYQVVFHLKINGRKTKLTVTNGEFPIEDKTFKALNLTLDSNGQLDTLFIECSRNSSRREVISKKLHLLTRSTEREEYIRRYTDFKLIRNAVELIEQEWELDTSIKFKIYSGTESETCAICQDDVQIGHTLQLKCKHLFHLDCLEDHISQVGEGASQCPMCRAPIKF